ncbi:uncharacterized protein v isoform X5 [Dermacentor andersoni]|uniref:uncharacterized protein v isoform X5 n=1 Tax=Dermacentor andersoni TaxID=34620 RepID=UPI003B3B8B34
MGASAGTGPALSSCSGQERDATDQGGEARRAPTMAAGYCARQRPLAAASSGATRCTADACGEAFATLQHSGQHRAGSQRRGPMVEAPLPCQIREIVASDTLPLRQSVLRPDLVRVDYRGDELPTTAHFGAYVDGRLVGVVSAFHESLVFPEAQRMAAEPHNCAPPSAGVAADVPTDGLSTTAADLDVEPAGKLGDQQPGSESNELICDQISALSVIAPYERHKETAPAVADPTADTQPATVHDMNGACREEYGPSVAPTGSKTGTGASAKVSAERPVRPPLPSVERAIQLASEASSWRIRGLAVDLPLRGRGVGSRLISTCIQHATDKRAACVWCVARCSAEPVYEKMGFQRAGQVFRLEGIGQVCYMIRALL